MDKQNNSETLHSFTGKQTPFITTSLMIFFSICSLFGIATGYLLAKQHPSTSQQTSLNGSGETLAKGTRIGSDDTNTFKDTAEGIMKKGGIEDEGQFHLVRAGGASQYVYLTSAIVDLSQLIDRKVKVWGQTQKAEKAGWLMDVGRVEVIE